MAPATTLCEVGSDLLKRLFQFQDRDDHIQAVIRDECHSLRHDLDPSAKAVICARHAERRSFAEFFRGVVWKTHTIGISSESAAQERENAEHRTPERYQWLKRLEGEIAAEDASANLPPGLGHAFLESHNQRFVQELLQREQQIAAWKSELEHKQDHRQRAIKLVLKFKADEHARRELRVANVMHRLAESSFPAELRLVVTEHVLGSPLSPRKTIESDGLDMLTDKCFSWPKNVDENDRKLLRQTAKKVLLDTCIVKLALIFVQPHVLMIPSSLAENTSNIRRLALELALKPRDGTYHRDLNRAIEGMPKLVEHFPRLKVCVITLLLDDDGHVNLEFFANIMSEYRNIVRDKDGAKWVYVPLERNLVELIASFIRCGPGSSKLLRLSRHTGSSPYKRSGPLLRVNGGTETKDDKNPSEVLAGGDIFPDDDQGRGQDPADANAKHILDQMLRSYST